MSNLRQTSFPDSPETADEAEPRIRGDAALPPSTTRSSWLLMHASHSARMRIESALKPCGLTGLQMTVLNLLKNRGGSSSAELSRRFFKTPQAMGQLLSPLVDRGLIARSEDPDNRRVLRLTLTDEGRKVHASGDAAMRRVEREVFSQFDQETLAILRAALYQISLLQPGTAGHKRNSK